MKVCAILVVILFFAIVPLNVSSGPMDVTGTFIPAFDYEPTVTSQIPPDGATSISINIGRLLCHVVDNDGDTMDVSFYWAGGTLIGTDTGVANDTDVEVTIPLLADGTIYNWYVIVDDSHVSVRYPTTGSWVFTTVSSGVGVVPLPPPPVIPNDITIYVLDGNNNPIPGATVSIYNSNIPVCTGTTCEEGIYTTSLRNGLYIFKATAEGYEESTEIVPVITDKTVTLSLIPYITAGMTIAVIIAIVSILLLIFAYHYRQSIKGLVGEKRTNSLLL